ncbi:MAG: sulfotransferase [Schleiferiaceae bacterium]
MTNSPRPLTSADLANAAYAALAEADKAGEAGAAMREQAASLLERCRKPEDDSLTLPERALIGASWIRAGSPARGLPYLDHDWSPASPEVAGLVGTALMNIGAIGPALPALKRAAEAKDVSPAIRINLGRALLMAGQTQEALAELERGRQELGEENSLATLSLAEALLAEGRIEEALDLVPESVDDEQLVGTRVRLLGAASRHEEAGKLLHLARERMPESTPILLLSAELAEVRGRTGEAVATLRKALEKDPDNIQLLVRLAHTGRKGAISYLAREAADRAMLIAADKGPQMQAVAMNAQAHVLMEEGKTAEAESTYRSALDLVPGMVPAMSGLGQLLMQNGKVDEAMDLFQQVRAVAPLQGWSQLIHAREVPDDPEVLENMERAARQPGLEGPARTNLLYTVAAAWDKKKDYDRAMKVAREANENAKKLLAYDPAAHRARVEREMARFSPEFIESRAGWGNPSRLPVFVLGMPRSGTTLTEQILGSHSQVFGAGELGLVGEQITSLEGWELHVGSRLHYPECVADLSLERSRMISARWLAKLQEFDPAARHVVDKLPHNFEHIGLIKLLFPNAIIFHCRRELRDIAVSNYITDYAAKFGGMGFAYDLEWIGEQLVDHDRLMAHWHQTFPGQIFEVVYEELVEDTENWARRMIDFMGLDWEPGVLDFQDLDRPVKTASVWQVRQPVYTTSKARWKRYEAHLGPLEAALQVKPSLPAADPLPNVEPGLFLTGMEHLKGGRLADAETCFLQVITAYPEHAAAYHFLGAAQLQQGKVDKAVRAMRHAVKLLPLHPTWFENLARAEQAAGNDDNANRSWAYGQGLRKRQAEAAQRASLPAKSASEERETGAGPADRLKL